MCECWFQPGKTQKTPSKHPKDKVLYLSMWGPKERNENCWELGKETDRSSVQHFVGLFLSSRLPLWEACVLSPPGGLAQVSLWPLPGHPQAGGYRGPCLTIILSFTSWHENNLSVFSFPFRFCSRLELYGIQINTKKPHRCVLAFSKTKVRLEHSASALTTGFIVGSRGMFPAVRFCVYCWHFGF